MLISQKLSPTRSLNNKGVLLLNMGRYEDAIRCFAIASKRLRPQAATKKAVQHEDGCETKNEPPVDSSRCSPERILDAARSVAAGVPAPRDGYAIGPPRKGTRRILTNTCFVPVYDLCRPLWIQSEEQRKTPLAYTSIVATLLYNKGLSFNLMAIRQQTNHEEARPIYRRALTLYRMAAEAMLRAPLSKTLLCPVFASVLHNLSQVHSAIEEHKEASKCRHEFANILRRMCPSGDQEAKYYETFYIKLLWIPRADFHPAAVA